MYNETWGRFWYTVSNAFGGRGFGLMLWLFIAIALVLAQLAGNSRRYMVHKRIRKPTDVGPFSRGQWYAYLIRVLTLPTVMYMSSGWAVAATFLFEIVGLGLLAVYIDWRIGKKKKGP